MRIQAEARAAFIATILLAGIAPSGAQTAPANDPAAAALVADQIREQGFACTEPATATPDPSVDDDSVWMLTCADAKYRVRLVPDQGAVVEKLD